VGVCGGSRWVGSVWAGVGGVWVVGQGGGCVLGMVGSVLVGGGSGGWRGWGLVGGDWGVV